MSRWLAQRFGSVAELKGCASVLVQLFNTGKLDPSTHVVRILLVVPDTETAVLEFMQTSLPLILRPPQFPVPWTYRVAVSCRRVLTGDDDSGDEEGHGDERGRSGEPTNIHVSWKYRPALHFSMSLRMEAELCHLFRGQSVRVADILRSPLFKNTVDNGGDRDLALKTLSESLERLSDPSIGAVQLRNNGHVVDFLPIAGTRPELDLDPVQYFRDGEKAFHLLSVSAVCNTPPTADTVPQTLPAPADAWVGFPARAKLCLQWYFFLRFCSRPCGGMLEYFMAPTVANAAVLDRNEVQRALTRFFQCEMLHWTLHNAQRPEVARRWVQLHEHHWRSGDDSACGDEFACVQKLRSRHREVCAPALFALVCGSGKTPVATATPVPLLRPPPRTLILFLPEKRLLVRALDSDSKRSTLAEICIHATATQPVAETTVRVIIGHILGPTCGGDGAASSIAFAHGTERLARLFVEHLQGLSGADRMQFTYLFFGFLAFIAMLRGDRDAGFRVGGKSATV